MTSIFVSSQWFGLPPYGGILAHCYGTMLLLLLVILEGSAIWKAIRVVIGFVTTNDNSMFFVLVFYLF